MAAIEAAQGAADVVKSLIPIQTIVEETYKQHDEAEDDLEAQFNLLLTRWETLYEVGNQSQILPKFSPHSQTSDSLPTSV